MKKACIVLVLITQLYNNARVKKTQKITLNINLTEYDVV